MAHISKKQPGEVGGRAAAARDLLAELDRDICDDERGAFGTLWAVRANWKFQIK